MLELGRPLAAIATLVLLAAVATLALLAGVAAAEDPCALPPGTYYAGARGSGLGGTALGNDAGGVGGTGLGDEGGVGGTGLGDEGGVGGTGLGDEGGVGGTGLGDEGGVGGTGLQAEGGVGGTGILGTVTGFGSVCVNGLRVAYGDGTLVILRGEPGRLADLERAQVVWLRAVERDGALWTDRIEIVSAALGVVESVDEDDRRIVVAGAAVQVPAGTPIRADGAALELGALAPGDVVDVAGLPAANGRLVASRIERLAEPPRGRARLAEIQAELAGRRDLARVSVEGYAGAPPERDGLRISGLDVRVPTAMRGVARAARDARVVVDGRVEGGILRAERLAIRPERAERPRARPEAPRPETRREPAAPRSEARELRTAPTPPRPERPETPDVPEIAPERPDRVERPDRPDRPERPDVERPERIERPAADVIGPRSAF